MNYFLEAYTAMAFHSFYEKLLFQQRLFIMPASHLHSGNRHYYMNDVTKVLLLHVTALVNDTKYTLYHTDKG
jgi:hypothetical protein